MERCFREEENMTDRRGSISLRAALACFLILAAHQAAQAGTLTTIHTFTGSPVDGSNATGVVIGPGGVLYGATSSGGNSSCYQCGTVFSLTPPATPGGEWTESVYSFPFPPAGDGPYGIIIGAAGAVLYDTTYGGGSCGNGNVFELRPPSLSASWEESVLFSFCQSGSNVGPRNAPAIGPDGVLYGTIAEGDGSVFSLTPPASAGGSWTENVLYTFNGEGDRGIPNSVAVGASGALYGTTQGNGGVVYSLTPPNTPAGPWVETILHNFLDKKGDGAYPDTGVLIGADGVLYGVTPSGGVKECYFKGCGIVYSLVPPASAGGGQYTVLHGFTGTAKGDGAVPSGGLAAHNGVLYGVTQYGGTVACRNPPVGGCGSIYSLTPPAAEGGAWTETVLYSFTGGSDGLDPLGQLAIDPSGVIYGVTATTVFSFTP